MVKKNAMATLLVTALFGQGEQQYIKEANAVAKDLLKTLGGNLKKELKANGPKAAVDFCSLKAVDLTQSVGKKYKDISVKRISLKPRNPANAPSSDERVILESLEKMVGVGVKPRNILQEKDGKVVVYKPLFIKKKVCLVCHGSVQKEHPKLYKKIHSIYATDKATGYKMGDLRGAIVVTMPK